ncbi:YHYH protein [Alteromonas sp. 1_MG-2023]|uniref:YHYH protein n=1 Tax=Alteromonas sp. 1_MG-2023 TaxID=3062669 RepID=UPI0026E32AF1|nr:YHYH protein [Alteromonas sp. 1_MG-2023]MDO6566408.1 YHYH protein [Alteromonas sp. 1_MG-2023]
MSKSHYALRALFCVSILSVLTACGGSSSTDETADSGTSVDTGTGVDTGSDSDSSTTTCDSPMTELSSAYLEFVAAPNVTIVLSEDGCTVSLESAGKPDHTSSYWDSGNASGLYVEPEDETLFNQQRSPGDIEDYINDYDLTVPVSPELAATSSATPLGAIGIALSGAPIFNDSEGTGDVSLGVIQGFDRNGAHTGPETYHYHLEPQAISYDDDSLVGIMADGFFIFGRRCYSTVGYPTDLDESNGHTSITLYTGASEEDAEYHYHVSTEQYLNGDYYLIFPGNFQGTPSDIN